METVRAPSLYVGSNKVAECSGGSVTVDTGAEKQIGDGEVIAVTDGVVSMDATFDTIIPVAGMKSDVLDIVLGQKYVKLSVVYAGKLLSAEGKMSGADLKWDQKTGSYTGSFKFLGGKPKKN